MSRTAWGIAIAALGTCFSAWPLTASAESCSDAPRARAAVLGGVTINDSAATVVGSFGYRVDRCFGLEFEIGVVPDLEDDPDVIPLDAFGFGRTPSVPIPGGIVGGIPRVQIFPPPTFENRLITFMTNARVEIPTTVRAIVPYVVGGGGIASLRREVTFPGILGLPDRPVPPGGIILPPILPRSSASTETALALNVGAGVSVRIVKELFADADMRYVRVFSNDELDLNRFGAGISYRF